MIVGFWRAYARQALFYKIGNCEPQKFKKGRCNNMVNYKPDRTDMGLWVICSAIGDEHEKAKQMKKNEDGTVVSYIDSLK